MTDAAHLTVRQQLDKDRRCSSCCQTANKSSLREDRVARARPVELNENIPCGSLTSSSTLYYRKTVRLAHARLNLLPICPPRVLYCTRYCTVLFRGVMYMRTLFGVQGFIYPTAEGTPKLLSPSGPYIRGDEDILSSRLTYILSGERTSLSRIIAGSPFLSCCFCERSN